MLEFQNLASKMPTTHAINDCMRPLLLGRCNCCARYWAIATQWGSSYSPFVVCL